MALMNAYLKNKSGAIAVVFAISLSMIIASAGIATDLAVVYNAKNRLSNALDKAALAIGSSTGDTAVLEERAEAFIRANYPEGKIGEISNIDVTISEEEATVDITASARVNTIFMPIFGIDYVDVSSSTQVIRELAGIEAVLVLDVTGSMAGTSIAALKTASTNFINIMFDEVDDINYLKIGVVPYADTINVGRYGEGFDPDGNYYDNAFVDTPTTDEYVSNPSTITYGTGTNDWWGCVVERTAEGEQMTDASTPNWHMYRYPRVCLRSSWSGCTQYATPNYGCGDAKVQPLTNNQSDLLTEINGLPTSGNTYSHLGMVWGWRVVSPTSPFTEGAEYDDPKWSKTVILMTDGDNTIDSVYSTEGRYGTSGVSTNATQENNKLAAVCQDMKDEGIRIYTVTFKSSINATTKSYYRACATSTSMYYDAPSADDLIAVFEKIAHQLSKLHITK